MRNRGIARRSAKVKEARLAPEPKRYGFGYRGRGAYNPPRPMPIRCVERGVVIFGRKVFVDSAHLLT